MLIVWDIFMKSYIPLYYILNPFRIRMDCILLVCLSHLLVNHVPIHKLDTVDSILRSFHH